MEFCFSEVPKASTCCVTGWVFLPPWASVFPAVHDFLLSPPPQ